MQLYSVRQFTGWCAAANVYCFFFFLAGRRSCVVSGCFLRLFSWYALSERGEGAALYCTAGLEASSTRDIFRVSTLRSRRRIWCLRQVYCYRSSRLPGEALVVFVATVHFKVLYPMATKWYLHCQSDLVARTSAPFPMP
jgi:hypothetical protein